MKKLLNSNAFHRKSGSLKGKAVFTGCLAHLVHDGFTDMIYIFFPIWQSLWALSFGEVGLLKSLLSGSMAFFQLYSGRFAKLLGPTKLLLMGTLLTSTAIMLIGWAATPLMLSLMLIMAGIGSSVQHPTSSSMIADVCEDSKSRRTSLSLFNFIGDVGKLILPFTASLFISYWGWQQASHLLALFGFGTALVLLNIMLRTASSNSDSSEPGPTEPNPTEFTEEKPTANPIFLGLNGYQAFWSLSAIGVIDGATRMAFLTFFPFLMHDKGASVTLVGFGLTLIFAGGATGKLVCGVLATRIGILRSVITTEIITALTVLGMVGLSLQSALLLAPILGIALNGTSSVLYGSVPELVPEEQRNQAFSVFYTVILGSGAIAPSVYGLFSDFLGIRMTMAVIALVVLVTIPLTFFLRGKFEY